MICSRRRAWGIVLLLGCAISAANCPAEEPAQASEQESAVTILAGARHFAWQVAEAVATSLEPKPGEDFPGIQAWLQDYRALRKTIDPATPLEKWPTIDVDKLVAHNPNFWSAYFEIAPGDAGIELMHAALLLSGGESSRALHLVVIEQYRRGTPKELWSLYEKLAGNAQHTMAKARAPVQEGIKLFDAGDYAGAAKKYQEQLTIWPQDGQAWYELGYTRFTQQLIAAGQKPIPPGNLQVNGAVEHSQEVLDLFAKTRLHDPFEWHAYQGSDQATVDAALVMLKRCFPEWQKLAREPAKVDSDTLDRFSTAAQEAGVYEAALAARQVVAARRGRYAPADHPIISACLRKLAPGPSTEAIVTRLAGPGPIAFKQIVIPEAPAAEPETPGKELASAAIQQVIMYVPIPELEDRIGNDVEPVADYVKALQKTINDIVAQEKQRPGAKGLLIAVGVRSKSQARVWCEAVEGEISPELQARLEQELAKLPAFDCKKPPMAFGLQMSLFGQKPAKFPGFPDLWTKAATEKKTTLSPPDELFETIWPAAAAPESK